MSPSMSHGPLTLLQRCSRVPSARSFSTSSTLLRIGPESPRFVEIPKSLQPAANYPQDIKGKLPVPRNLFPRRAGDKTSSEYFAKTTPEPTSDRQIETSPNKYVAWKRQLASTRRAHLREALLALHERKVVVDKRVAAASAKKQNHRKQILNRPPRLDEQLTANTIRQFNKMKQHGAPPDPRREERLAQKAANVLAHQQMKAELRQDALHTLYVDAHSFITTIADFEKQVEEEFQEDKFSSLRGNAKSIWDVQGPQPTLYDLLKTSDGKSRTAVGIATPLATLNNKRVLRIAEELTGGKMST